MQFKRSSIFMKILILVLVVYATATLVSKQEETLALQAQAKELREQIEIIKEENARQRSANQKLDSDEGIESVAREMLGWASDGEIVFYDVSN